MTRTTIAGHAAGTSGSAAAPGRQANGVNASASPAADAGEDGALVDQFTREFNAVLRQVKETQRGSSDAVTAFSADGDAQTERTAVAHYGAISQRLLSLVRRLLDRTDELAVAKKALLLLSFGGKFAAVLEYTTADRYFYQQVLGIWRRDSEKPKNQVYVQAAYGAALCQFHAAKRADSFVRFPGTLEKLLVALQGLQHGMETAVQLERATPHQYSWLLLNGSVLIYSIAHPLQLLGFEREVVAYFKWCVLCLESTVMLSTTKYILWRLQIYSNVCECLERMASKSPTKATNCAQAALACAEHALQAVKRLRKEEELDLPLPALVISTLREADTIVNMLVARCQSLSKGEFFGRKAVEGAVAASDTRDRLRLIVDALEKSLTLSIDNAGVLELFTLAMETVSPLFHEEDPASASTIDVNALLPLSFHLGLVRHAYRLQRLQDAAKILQAAKRRIASLENADTLRMEMQIYDALLQLDKPTEAEETTEGVVAKPLRMDLLLVVAQEIKDFVRKNRDALTTPMRDFLQAVALRVWYEGAMKVVQELDSSPKPSYGGAENLVVNRGIALMEAVYVTLRKIEFEDLVLLGEVAIRMCIFLHLLQDRRRAIRTLRDYLALTEKYRDSIATASNHFSSHVGVSSHAMAYATFSFDVDASRAKSDCQTSETTLESSRQSVGVEGTGSQFGGLYQELVGLQVDALLILFQLELEEANVLDAIAVNLAAPSLMERVSRRPTAVAVTESALQKEYKKNTYARVLLNVQRMRQSSIQTPEQTTELATECFTLLRQAEVQERDLLKNVAESNSQAAMETAAPRAPRIIMRSSSAIAVEIFPFKPATAAAQRRAIAYYMVFAKPSGAGTAVSLNNSEYPGTGEPIYAPQRRVTVSGLSANTSYVFAVAAFDADGEAIEGIGATTKPVVAVNPLPLAACYGYLAQACYEQKLMEPARQAAMKVYDYVSSKECGNRPGWASNFFYRHSLKREVIARWPIPLLNLAVQSILVICDEEIGDALRDGQLTSEGNMLRPKQIAVMEAGKMIAIGLEIACAAVDLEQIRVLCFKGYRVLLPLLHLDDANALTFAALATYYQALWCIPSPLWDTDTRSIAARVAFELMKIAWRHRHIAVAIFEQVAKLKTLESSNSSAADTISSNELSALLDSIALAECVIGQAIGSLTPGSRPTTAVVAPLATGKTAPPGAAAVKAPTEKPPATPQPATPEMRDGELPHLRDLIAQSKLNLRDTFKLLEPFVKGHRDSLEVLCKLCHSAITAGDEAAVDEWIPQMKISGRFGAEFKGVLKRVGFEHLLPEPAPVAPTQPTPSAPTTARSSAKTPRGPDTVAALEVPTSPRAPVVEPQYGEDDEYLYTWCGELCLIQAKILMGKIVQQRSPHDVVDISRGPTYDFAFHILKDGASVGIVVSASQEELPEAEISTSRSRDENTEAPPSSRTDGNSVVELLPKLLTRIAAACRMFVLAKAWQSLQIAVQHVAKVIWLVWVSPDDFANGGPLAMSLDSLTACVDAILDMIEFITYAIKDEQCGRVATTVSPGVDDAQATINNTRNATLSLASTTVVVSAMSSVNADQTWISSLLEFVVQALLAAKQWHKLVLVGKKYHLLSGGGSRFSEKMISVLVFAQQQYLAEQTALLETAQTTLAAFVKAFHDAEAKKKKKKSRLVVEEVLTPEEIEFRAKKDVMEQEIHALLQERNSRQLELDTIQQMHDAVTRSTNKCTQALDSCHDLVEKYRRHGDSVVKTQQVVNAFTHCVALARQKRQRRVAGKALQELGDFLWERGEVKAAVKAWNEAIDNAFNALHSTTCWRDVLGTNTDEDKEQLGDPWIEGEGLWICLESCIAMKKLILHDSLTANTSTVELARMAAAAFKRIVTRCSLPHPTRGFLDGTYRAFGQLWPGRELLEDTERLDATRLGTMCVVVIQILLQYEQSAEAMPLIMGYEYLARQIFEDIGHVANALCLRMEALTQCGRFHDAFETLACLLMGVSIEGREAKPTKGGSVVEKLQFRDDTPLKDSANSGVIAWLTALDSSQVNADLLAHQYKPEIVRTILVSTLKLILALSLREPIEEEASSAIRQVANKMAVVLSNSLSQPPQDQESEASDAGRTIWETLEMLHARAEVLLLHSIIAFGGGQWNTAQDLAIQVVQQAADSRKVIDSIASPHTQLSLEHRVPTLLVLKPSTLTVRARLISVRCDLAKGAYKTAMEQVALAIKEARSHGEPSHYVLQLELQRVQALVFLGSSATASRELSQLHEAFVKSHSQESAGFVELLRMQATLLRNDAMEGNDTMTKLARVLVLLDQAEENLDRLLRRDGWIGVDVMVASEKRLSLYHPCIPPFVHLKVEIIQVLMDTPMSNSNQRFQNQQRALLSIDVALRAVDHSVKSLTPLKARLLFFHGSIMKTMLMASGPTVKRAEDFATCVSALTSCIEEAIRVESGGHDRELICLALLELVDLYGAKVVVGHESKHLQAAFHFLNLALSVRSSHQAFFNSLELQAGSITNADKLPMFVVSAILSQQPTVAPGAGDSVKSAPAPAPTGKGAAPQPAATDAAKKVAGVDTQRVVNYFIRTLREKEVLPACTVLQQDVAVLLHAFLVQNHSSYAKVCCLPSLPPVPRDDPEIRAGLICAHWKRELAPAFSEHPDTLSLFFTLGTTRIDRNTDTVPSADQEAIQQRTERFATAPLLSKRTGVAEKELVPVREQLSQLRIQMEDEDSLVVDRSAFSSIFYGVLRQIQNLLHVRMPTSKTVAARQPEHDDSETAADTDATSNEGVQDSFGLEIPVSCTLDAVKLLEAFLHIERGVHNAADTTLCYFLRDILDN